MQIEKIYVRNKKWYIFDIYNDILMFVIFIKVFIVQMW